MTYQQWNTRRGGMSNGGAIRAQGNESLTDDQLRTHVPSLFAADAHGSRSERFVAIPTIDILTGLRAEGFSPVFAQQQQVRKDQSRRDFTKHMLRMRHNSLINSAGESFEIILINGNDGSSGYKMLPGYFRFVCMNGLFLGDTFKPVTVRHTGKALAKVIQGAFDVLALADNAAAVLDRFKGTQVPRDAQDMFAQAVHYHRFPDAWGENPAGDLELIPNRAPADPSEMLTVRRSDDNANDLFTLWNVAQENAIRGGFRGRIASEASRRGFRNATAREVTGIAQNQTLNQKVTNSAFKLADLLG